MQNAARKEIVAELPIRLGTQGLFEWARRLLTLEASEATLNAGTVLVAKGDDVLADPMWSLLYIDRETEHREVELDEIVPHINVDALEMITRDALRRYERTKSRRRGQAAAGSVFRLARAVDVTLKGYCINSDACEGLYPAVAHIATPLMCHVGRMVGLEVEPYWTRNVHHFCVVLDPDTNEEYVVDATHQQFAGPRSVSVSRYALRVLATLRLVEGAARQPLLRESVVLAAAPLRKALREALPHLREEMKSDLLQLLGRLQAAIDPTTSPSAEKLAELVRDQARTIHDRSVGERSATRRAS